MWLNVAVHCICCSNADHAVGAAASLEQSAATGVDVGTDAAAAFLITGGFVYFGMSTWLLFHAVS